MCYYRKMRMNTNVTVHTAFVFWVISLMGNVRFVLLWRGQMSYQFCVTPDICPIRTPMDVHPCFLSLFWSALSSFPFHCSLQDDFGQTWWSGDVTVPLKKSRQKKRYDSHRKSVGSRQMNEKGESKVESNDSPEIPDRGETSDTPGLFGEQRC